MAIAGLFDRTLDGKTIRMAERQGSIAATGARLARLLDYDATIIALANIWPRNMVNCSELSFSAWSDRTPRLEREAAPLDPTSC